MWTPLLVACLHLLNYWQYYRCLHLLFLKCSQFLGNLSQCDAILSIFLSPTHHTPHFWAWQERERRERKGLGFTIAFSAWLETSSGLFSIQFLCSWKIISKGLLPGPSLETRALSSTANLLLPLRWSCHSLSHSGPFFPFLAVGWTLSILALYFPSSREITPGPLFSPSN